MQKFIISCILLIGISVFAQSYNDAITNSAILHPPLHKPLSNGMGSKYAPQFLITKANQKDWKTDFTIDVKQLGATTNRTVYITISVNPAYKLSNISAIALYSGIDPLKYKAPMSRFKAQLYLPLWNKFRDGPPGEARIKRDFVLPLDMAKQSYIALDPLVETSTVSSLPGSSYVIDLKTFITPKKESGKNQKSSDDALVLDFG